MKRRIQQYMDGLSAEHRQISLQVREVIFAAIPEVEENLKWSVPFYTFKGPKGYLTLKGNQVMFSFYWGKLMEDPFNVFVKNELKQVRQLAIPSLEEWRRDVLKAYLYESIVINEQLDKPKFMAPKRKE